MVVSKPVTSTDLYMLNGKALYKYCVQALSKRKLSGRKDTVWRERLKVQDDWKPVWRLFYKPPLNKRSGDLQWRILQGALAVNSFVSKINPTISTKCPFCQEPETVFHCFLDYKILVFVNCGESWSETAFIFGTGHRKENAKKYWLLNCVVGQAKLSIYKSRKNQIRMVQVKSCCPYL